MKKILNILLLLPLSLFAQTFLSIEQDSPLNLVEGWNMFGFSCYEPMDVAEAFSPIFDKVLLVKDNNGAAYLPEFGYNGIGYLERNLGYQLKLTESIIDFQFCPFIFPSVVGCKDETAFNYNESTNIDDGSCIAVIEGCIDSLSFYYNELANTIDDSCIDVVYGCTDPNADNFSGNANTDNDSCIYFGCTDNLTCNYNAEANTDDGS